MYALDVDDVLSYLGPNFTGQQLNKMVFNTESEVFRHVWLRSGSFERYYCAYTVSGTGTLIDFNYNGSIEVRPAFVLDLSLLS